MRLDARAGADAMGKNRDAALAVRRGDVDGLRDALERGANPNHVCDIFGPNLDLEWSLLETAARNGNVDCCTLLVAAGVDVNSISPSSPEGAPLHPACGQGDAAVVSLLLAAGADVDVRGLSGYTPLFTACNCAHGMFPRSRFRGHAAIVQLLLDTGATNLRDRATSLERALL